ncbi:MAG TPA: hypothetical protein EYQ62_06850 [Verrucomicrobiales bacterium]|nr:hypothetical protein [Verrucomicrobiales bacterium]
MIKNSLILTAVVLSLILVPGCGEKTTPPTEESTGEPVGSGGAAPQGPHVRVETPTAKPSPQKTSMAEVAKHLDFGGSFYLYLSTEQVLAKLDGYLDAASALADEAGQWEFDEQQRQQIAMAVDMGRTAYEQIGVRDISGFGMSSFALEGDLNRAVMVLHHYPEKKDGLLWKMMGAQSHEQQILKMLPADTVVAIQADLDLVTGFEWMRKFITDTAHPDLVAEFAKGLAQMNQAIKFEDLLRSTGGEMGFFVTLNDAKQIAVPLPPDAPQGLSLSFAEPGLAILIKVKDDQLMKLITAQLQNPELAEMVKQSQEGGETLYTMTTPPLPVDIDLSPTLMKAGDYIILTTSLKLAKDILAVREGKNQGLAGTAEFKRLKGDMDLKGNQLHFMSDRLGKEFGKLMKSANDYVTADAKAGGSLTTGDLLGKLSGDNFAAVSGQLSVLRVTPEGIVMESRSSGDAMGAAPLLLVGGAGIGASMLLPALARAKAKANAIKSVNNASQLGRGLHGYASENAGRLPPANQWCDAILREVGTEQVFMSPQDPTMQDDGTRRARQRSSYAMNAAVAGKNLNELSPDTVLVFEFPVGWNGTGGLADINLALARKGNYRNLSAIAVTMVDGSSRQANFAELGLLNWTGQRRR